MLTQTTCRASVNQVVDYAKVSQATTASVDGTNVVGGTVGQIPLGNAAFTPSAAQQQGGGAPPAGAAPATTSPAPAEAPAEAPAVPAEAAM